MLDISRWFHLARYFLNREAQKQLGPEREPTRATQEMSPADAALAMALMNDAVVVETPRLVAEVKAGLTGKK